MKTRLLAIFAISLALASSHAQFGNPAGSSQGIRFNGMMAKLFGPNGNFSANLEMEMKGGALTDTVRMPGRIFVVDNKSRYELDTTQIKGGGVAESSLAQMKTMGMDKTVMISRPDQKISFLIYPNLQAYTETPMSDVEAAEKDSNFKMETTEMGKETVDAHPCVKTKAVLTDDKGGKQEATVWNATDLKNFPIKLERNDRGITVTMLFKDVKLGKPDSTLFDPAPGMTKYENGQALMQGAVTKRFGNRPGAPGKQAK